MEVVLVGYLWLVCCVYVMPEAYNPGEYYGPMDGRLDQGYSLMYPYDQNSNIYDTAGYMADDRGSDWAALGGPSYPLLGRAQCMTIPANLSLCQNMDYNKMRLPNLLDHDTINEVIEQSRPWNSLVSINCHPDAQIFLCSLFAPICLESFHPVIQPCRSLCQAVKQGCEGRMAKRGFPWPEMLQCDRFPLTNGMCIRPQADMTRSGQRLCPPCSQPDTFEAIMDNYCSAASVMRINVRKTRKSGDGTIVVVAGKSKKFYKEEAGIRGMKKRLIKSMDVKIIDAQKCECQVKPKVKYLAMGRVVGGAFEAHALHEYNRGNKELKRAMRVMKKDDTFCQIKGVEILTLDSPAYPAPKRRRRDKKRKTRKSKTVN